MSRTNTSLLDHLKSWPLALLPHQLLSRTIRRATRWSHPWWKNFLIRHFVRIFSVNMNDAVSAEAGDYADFNAFFTRALRSGARPFPVDVDAIASPVDGHISACGNISEDAIFQAKGRDYSMSALLGGDPRHSQHFINGRFVTLYLSPRDYHRIHMPCHGRLLETVYIPGRLFSVAPHTTRAIDHLFTRNERLVSFFETDAGPMALVMVGAIFVSCMETVWDGIVNPRMGMSRQTRQFDQTEQGTPALKRGDEMGRFNMGSTVILLFGPGQAIWDSALKTGQAIRMGQSLGTLHRGENTQMR